MIEYSFPPLFLLVHSIACWWFWRQGVRGGGRSRAPRALDGRGNMADREARRVRMLLQAGKSGPKESGSRPASATSSAAAPSLRSASTFSIGMAPSEVRNLLGTTMKGLKQYVGNDQVIDVRCVRQPVSARSATSRPPSAPAKPPTAAGETVKPIGSADRLRAVFVEKIINKYSGSIRTGNEDLLRSLRRALRILKVLSLPLSMQPSAACSRA
jgi:hypothetical protein